MYGACAITLYGEGLDSVLVTEEGLLLAHGLHATFCSVAGARLNILPPIHIRTDVRAFK
jgi:hypothetical protein